MRMLFQDLKAFVTVVESASLTKAADTLCLTQSAVSRRIQHLEETLGEALFDRSTRPPLPNALGQRIYEKAVELLKDAEHLLNIPRQDALPSGRFRVGLTQIVADAVVFDVVTRMRAQLPGLELQIVTDWSSELERRMLLGELDAATLMLPAATSPSVTLASELITTLDILVVQSKRHPLVSAPIAISRLAACEWVLNPKGCGYRAALEAAMGGQGHPLKLAVDTHGASVQMRMVAAGMGLGLIPAKLLPGITHAEDLAIVSISDFQLQMGVWLTHSRQPGNLRLANELLAASMTDGLR
ncbi:LysR family transcriptional regulator [Pseudomonas tolaasii]|nr:LysR family transcriptional regulator [Pseudomonas tolaasii]NWA49758.1 LysR family transcriptional regulator [Pseudomonas tolaasii]